MAPLGPGDRPFTVRPAIGADLAAVLSVLDGANLATDAGAIREAIAAEAVLVAERDGANPEPRPLLGALVLEGSEITHVAVRRGRRGQGIGTALVETAASERDRLRARFDADVRPFYAALGFDVEPVNDRDRYRGRYGSNDR